MLIPLQHIVHTLNNLKREKIKGVLHVGAHECEEHGAYLKANIDNNNIFWVEAMPEKVNLIKQRNKNINIYHSVIDMEDDKEIIFNVSNNGQSSSILSFGTHSKHHPHIKMVKTIPLKTTRLDTFINKYNIPMQNINFLNFDIQGKELDALKSMGDFINHIQYIYTEVNTEQVYKNCALLTDIDDFLKQKGFSRIACKMWDGGKCGWGDAFYIKDH